MNLVIRSGWKEKLDNFNSAKSRNKSFKKILTESDTAFIADGVFLRIPKEFTEWCFNFIEDVVNKEFRNPEVHYTGKARKWIFTESEEEKEYIKKFYELIKNMWQFLNIIGTIAGGRKFCKQIDKNNK